MFTKQELTFELPRQLASAPLPVDVFAFDHSDFSPDPESYKQYLWVFVGEKHAVGTALAFWIEALIALRDCGWPCHPSNQDCEHSPMSREHFAQWTGNFTRTLEEPIPSILCRLDEYKWGMRMHNEWDEHSFVAELADSFVAIFWIGRTWKWDWTPLPGCQVNPLSGPSPQ